MAKSWTVQYWSTNGETLIGGVLRSESSRWGSKEDAEQFLEVVKQNNGANCDGKVVPKNKYPEIFRHCEGSPAQALGGHCPKCKKKLTILDAKQHKG